MKGAAFILVFLVMSISGDAQSISSSIQNLHPQFKYKNQPISPEALLPFLPGMEGDDTIRPWVISLKDSVYTMKVDTGAIGWYSCAYDCGSFDPCYIGYKIIQEIKDERLVLWVYWNGGGTLTFPYIFILSLRDDKIIRVGNFLAEPTWKNPNQTIEIKGNKIINGEIHYTIPN
jgi:hypothetical protein